MNFDALPIYAIPGIYHSRIIKASSSILYQAVRCNKVEISAFAGIRKKLRLVSLLKRVSLQFVISRPQSLRQNTKSSTDFVRQQIAPQKPKSKN